MFSLGVLATLASGVSRHENKKEPEKGLMGPADGGVTLKSHIN